MNTSLKILITALLATGATQIFASTDALEAPGAKRKAKSGTVQATVPVLAPTATAAPKLVKGATVSALTAKADDSDGSDHEDTGTGAVHAPAPALTAKADVSGGEDSDDDTQKQFAALGITDGSAHASASATHVSDAPALATAAAATAIATAAAEETDADFAKRVLAQFPELKPAELTNAHYTTLFGAPSKGMSKLIAARKKFEAGLTTYTE